MLFAYEESLVSPSNHSTNPFGIDLHADPDPCRAKIDSSFSENLRPKAATVAIVRAANPDADDESPVPDGKLFFVTILAQRFDFAIFLI
jgi:hypothetical protein